MQQIAASSHKLTTCRRTRRVPPKNFNGRTIACTHSHNHYIARVANPVIGDEYVAATL